MTRFVTANDWTGWLRLVLQLLRSGVSNLDARAKIGARSTFHHHREVRFALD
jgi:hypothetical protein